MEELFNKNTCYQCGKPIEFSQHFCTPIGEKRECADKFFLRFDTVEKGLAGLAQITKARRKKGIPCYSKAAYRREFLRYKLSRRL